MCVMMVRVLITTKIRQQTIKMGLINAEEAERWNQKAVSGAYV